MFLQIGTYNDYQNLFNSNSTEQPKTFATDKLINSIMRSDSNRDGQVSRQEINSRVNVYESYISYYNMLKQFLPFWGHVFDSYIQNLQEQLQPIKFIKDNYDTFSDAGKDPDVDMTGQPVGNEHQINGTSYIHLVQSAESDGDIYNFSEQDLTDLQGKVPQT